MTEIDERIKEVVDQILTISGKKKLDKSTPTGFSDADTRLEIISRRIVEKENNLPSILWNVSPSNNFNILHAIYLIKLKQCIDLGFNCIIVLYDKSVEKELQIPPHARSYVQEYVKNCIRWFIKAGLIEDKTEFIKESDLWSFIKFEDFAETVTSFSHICIVDSGLAGGKKIASIIMDNLFEIYYENLINCDVLLAGKKDEQEIWSILKNKILIEKLCPNYIPPLVISFPTLKGPDSTELSTSSDENSLSIRHTRDELKTRIDKSPIAFLDLLFSFLIIPWKKKLHIANGKEIYTWEELHEIVSESEIRKMALDYIDQYFLHIRGVSNDY